MLRSKSVNFLTHCYSHLTWFVASTEWSRHACAYVKLCHISPPCSGNHWFWSTLCEISKLASTLLRFQRLLGLPYLFQVLCFTFYFYRLYSVPLCCTKLNVHTAISSMANMITSRKFYFEQPLLVLPRSHYLLLVSDFQLSTLHHATVHSVLPTSTGQVPKLLRIIR